MLYVKGLVQTKSHEMTFWDLLCVTVLHNMRRNRKVYCKCTALSQLLCSKLNSIDLFIPHSMAGSDSTATAVRCIFFYIMTNPTIYRKLQAEIDEADRKGTISKPIKNAEAKTLPYLQACIKEGLRMWPPLTGLMTKLVPPGGDTLNGMFIPGGTKIGYSAWATHHRKETFGEDSYMYRPERWLEATGDRLRYMENSNELVFGSGRYKCLGNPIAFVELNKVFVEVCDYSLVLFMEPLLR